jgi:hypothetical protein
LSLLTRRLPPLFLFGFDVSAAERLRLVRVMALPIKKEGK